MAKKDEPNLVIKVSYDQDTDILTFSFTETPHPALAEEAADEVWVRYDPQNHRVITVDVHNFSTRVRTAFGPSLTYVERMDPDILESLHGLPLPGKSEKS